ncbi:MAG: hypothetical protein HYU28_09795 [Actinobacteria bacterium]|nr:hypothetical protein [Actinomycetota bacterium]
MGFLKDFKSTVNNAKEMQAVGMQMQQQYQEDMQRAAEADPNDPDFQPIEGVTLDQYATIQAHLIKNAVVGPENVNAYAESQGVPAGQWDQIAALWTARMSQSGAVRNRYGAVYQSAIAS